MLNLKRAYKRFIIWRLRHMGDRTFLLMLSVIVGLLSGFAAVILKTLVHVTNRSLLHLHIPTVLGGNLLILLYPAIGIILTILFVKYIVKGQIGHGLPSVLLSLSRNNGILPARNMYSSLVASTLTVAFGGSVGLEAPIASTGSAIGSNIGRFFRLDTHGVKLLLGCGAAGAIAGIFKAPIAGVLFVIEVFMFDLTATSVLPLMLSAVSAATVAYFLMGNDLQFAFQVVGTSGLSQIPFYIALGIFCAAVSIYFLRTTDAVEDWFARRKSQMSRVLWGIISLGVLIFLFPPLFGEGYAFLTELLNGSDDMLFEHSLLSPLRDNTWVVIAYLLILILMKGVHKMIASRPPRWCRMKVRTVIEYRWYGRLFLRNALQPYWSAGAVHGQFRPCWYGGRHDRSDACPIHGNLPYSRNHWRLRPYGTIAHSIICNISVCISF